MKYYSLFFLNVAYTKKKMMINDANTEKLKRTPRTRKIIEGYDLVSESSSDTN
jgi:hypothetical protein